MDPKPVIDSLKLDKSLLVLEQDEKEFLKSETRITTTEELKEHIYAVQEEAYKVYPFPCIQRFGFTTMKISRLPAYQDVLGLAKARPDAIFLDAGCCFGNDSRKIVRDGFPLQNVVAGDLYPEFWNLGHKLFRSTQESFPAKFIPGDIFDPNILALPNDNNPIHDLTDLQSLTSLNPLRGHVSFIHASSFFHLFSEEKQLQLARLLAGLLDPRPGSIIFGSHVGFPQKGSGSPLLGGSEMFCHSPESWIDLWENKVFEKGAVKVEASPIFVKTFSKAPTESAWEFFMAWSVRRL